MRRTPTPWPLPRWTTRPLEIVLTYDCPYFEEIMAFPATFPVRQDIVEGNEEWTYDPATYIGNGQYRMTEWSHNAYILTEKNPEYYDYENLGPDTIRYTLLDDDNAILAAYNSGELQFIESLPTDEVANYLASGELQIVDYIGTYYVCFNTEDEIFSDPRIRKAFSLVIDRNYIVEQVTQTGQVPASGFVPYGVYDAEGSSGDDFRTVGGDYYSVAAEDYEANCEEARQLLAEAGYPDGEGFPGGGLSVQHRRRAQVHRRSAAEHVADGAGRNRKPEQPGLERIPADP